MGRYRDFDAARAERAGEQIEFKVGGEEFAVDGTLPGGVILELAEAMASGDQFAAMGLTAELFKGIVRPEDTDRFAAAVRTVDMMTMLDLLSWIIEEATGRPLPNASPSEPASSEGGSPSRVVSLSPAKGARSA